MEENEIKQLENLLSKYIAEGGNLDFIKDINYDTLPESDAPKEFIEADKILKSVFLWDEKCLIPGVQVYTIKESEKAELPYPRFVPEKAVIVSKHSSGVDEGYLYEFYRPGVKSQLSTKKNAFAIEYRTDYIYSPMTLPQAKILCRNLNKQMKSFYNASIKKNGNDHKNR